MKVDIDLAADAATLVWGRPEQAASQVVRRPGRRGVRLFFNADGDVVGLEVLGWSQRVEQPTDVEVAVHPRDSAQRLTDDDPLAQAFARASIETDDDHRPFHEGRRMLTLAEASALIGHERSWVSREMASGRLHATKIGRTWWTSPEWVAAYLRDRERGAIRTRKPLPA
jgi:hypothetical protein